MTVGETVALPKPKLRGTESLESVLAKRRTRRRFSSRGLDIGRLSQLLWAAQGVTDAEHGYRTTPSGGAVYPLALYVIVGHGGVEGLDPGLYRHEVEEHRLGTVARGELRDRVDKTMFDHPWVATAPVNIIIAARYQPMVEKFGPLGRRYTDIEVGHMAENICLQAVAMDLAVGLVVAFDAARLATLLELPSDEEPIYSLPIGYAAEDQR